MKSHCRGGVPESWVGDTSFLGLGDINGKINATKKQKELNQAFVSARGMTGVGGEISALQTPDLTFLLSALHSGSRIEHAGKRVCTTSLCWRQLRLLPASLHPTIFL